MTTDLSERLSALRPAPQFPTLERQAMIDTILNTDRAVAKPLTAMAAMAATRSPRRRRFLACAAVVGLAAAAAIVVPALVPSRAPGGATPAAAAELHRLAVITAHHRSATLGPGQYWYVDQTLTQTGDARDLFGDPNPRRVTLTARYLSWTDQHGDMWRQEQSTDQNGKPGVSTDYFPAHANSDESPDFLASLPTTADNLRDYLRAHATGSDSVDEAVFVAIEPILQGGIASAQLRAAAVQVLAETDHISLTRDARASTGLSAERFDFIDQTNRPDTIQSIYFDPNSAQVLETSTTASNSTSVEIVHQAHVTDSVPTAIRKTAVRQK